MVYHSTVYSPKNDINVRNIVRRVKPQHRLKAIWALAIKKHICEPDSLDEENGDATAEDQFQREQKPKGHGGCGHEQPQWRKEGLKFIAVTKASAEKGEESGEQEKRVVSPGEIHNLLQKISPEDLHIMGLNAEYARPDWMVLTILPVPPAAVRPSISVNGGAMRSEDDLTYKLAQILKTSATVRRLEGEGAPPTVVNEHFDLLQYHVATYMDNELAGLPQDTQKSGRPIKAIRARLKGKEGRLRGNLMGKRVDFSARTVITGDPNLMLDEVGVPRSIAMTLTYPERVTPYNIGYLQQLVVNGPTTYPGARYYVKDTGERVDLKYRKSSEPISLQFGWIVERHLKDGDYVLFNRQPSLHKMSMMSHRVKLMNYSSESCNSRQEFWLTRQLSVLISLCMSAALCRSPLTIQHVAIQRRLRRRRNELAVSLMPWTSDFAHSSVPQSEETRAELSQIAWVPRQVHHSV